MEELLKKRQELLAGETDWEELAEVENKIVKRLATRDSLVRDPSIELAIPGEPGSVVRYVAAAGVPIEDAQEVLHELVAIIKETGMTAARERAREYYGDEWVADRVLQEIILESGRITDDEIAAQMPLVEPENDLSELGRRRYTIEEKDDHYVLVEEEHVLCKNQPPGTAWIDIRRFPFDNVEPLYSAFRELMQSLPEKSG